MPTRNRYVNLKDPKCGARVEDGCVHLSADVPVKGVAVESSKEGIVFEDNCVDLVPGETVRIVAKGLVKGDMVTLRYLL